MSRGLYLADLVTVIGTQDLVFVKLIVKLVFVIYILNLLIEFDPCWFSFNQ